jgi:hypothetical protein
MESLAGSIIVHVVQRVKRASSPMDQMKKVFVMLCMSLLPPPFLRRFTIISFHIASGKNVCLYYLLGICKFGDLRSIYLHSKANLDPNGWWNDEKEVFMRRGLLEGVKREAKERRAVESLIWSLQNGSKRTARFGNRSGSKQGASGGGKGKGKQMQRKTPGNGLLKGQNRDPRGSGTTKGKGNAERGSESFLYELRWLREAEQEQRMMNGGFTDDEIMELACQGVKPWDDDAWVRFFSTLLWGLGN